MSDEKDKAVQAMLGARLGAVAEGADAVVLIFGTGCVFLRPSGEPHKLEQPAFQVDLSFGHDERGRYVRSVSVKETRKTRKSLEGPGEGQPG